MPIRETWIISQAARRVYFLSALLTIAFFGTWFATRFAMAAMRTNQLTPTAATLVRALLFPGVVGAATLWVAMWYFWFNFDKKHWATRAAWFSFLFFVAPISTLFYYFVVYRHYDVGEARQR